MYKVNDGHNLRLIDFISYSGRMKTKPRPNSWTTIHCLCNFIVTPGLHLGIKTQKPLFTNEEDLLIINSMWDTGHGECTRKPHRASSYLNLNFPASKC